MKIYPALGNNGLNTWPQLKYQRSRGITRVVLTSLEASSGQVRQYVGIFEFLAHELALVCAHWSSSRTFLCQNAEYLVFRNSHICISLSFFSSETMNYRIFFVVCFFITAGALKMDRWSAFWPLPVQYLM